MLTKLDKVYIGRTYLTPDGDEFGLIEIKLIGRKKIYVYSWNAPNEIKSVISNKLQTKTLVQLPVIIAWIDQQKKEYLNYIK